MILFSKDIGKKRTSTEAKDFLAKKTTRISRLTEK